MMPAHQASPPSPGPTKEILGTPLQCTSYDEFTAYCQWRSQQAGSISVDFSNTHIVTLRRHDRSFRDVTNQFDYFVPDAMPLIWALNRQGADLRDRVYGPTFMRRCIVASPAPLTHYFLGGSQDCLVKLREFFLRQNPRIQIVGSCHGYFQRDAEAEIIAEINQLSPDFLWIGLGTPKQQEFIERHKAAIQRGVILAVGFAFDVNAGTKKDAPAWMQRAGLTWLHRLASEPRRLGPRYFKFNSLFLAYLLKDVMMRRKSN